MHAIGFFPHLYNALCTFLRCRKMNMGHFGNGMACNFINGSGNFPTMQMKDRNSQVCSDNCPTEHLAAVSQKENEIRFEVFSQVHTFLDKSADKKSHRFFGVLHVGGVNAMAGKTIPVNFINRGAELQA